MNSTVALYLKLFAASLLPVIVSIAVYLLKRKTRFENLSYMKKQIIIGIAFGLVAIFGTEFGVDIGGATANSRDAAPLCAGLLFGAPAGIIAGAIGGIERYVAVLWGAGKFTQFACSISTLLAGVYAAVLRKYMFDNKRPTWGFGFACGVVMEVIHMTIVFLSNFNEAETAFEVVQVCTFPMIICNSVAVALSIIAVSHLSGAIHKGRGKYKKISEQVQTWLLVYIVIAYFATTSFVFRLQSGIAINDAETKISGTLTDVKEDIIETSDKNLIYICNIIVDELERNGTHDLSEMAERHGVTDIYIVNEYGYIVESSGGDNIGFDMNSGEQSAAFMVLADNTSGIREFVQEYGSISENSSERRKYAGVSLSKGGFVQVGFDSDDFHDDIATTIKGIAHNRHVGNNGFIVIADEKYNLVSVISSKAEEAEYPDFKTLVESNGQGEYFNTDIFGETYYASYMETEGYYIFAVVPTSEIYASRNLSTYINSYMEVIVFAVLFAVIYGLIKRLVVKNINRVNKGLSDIIGGDLDTVVNVRTCDEFSSLSDDINTTVSTLKHYISEAAARIDAELEFAKKIQHSALPAVFPPEGNKPYEIYATMHTAKEVGGDFYDFYKLGESKLAFLIADVSGKGIPAAMFMMTAKTMIKNMTESGLAIDEVMRRSNNHLCEGNEAGMFVTAWFGILDLRTGHVDFVNAGHNPPLIYRKETGKYEYIKSKVGLVLAGMEDFPYKTQTLELKPGDRMYLYTDGVTEATDNAKQLWGEERLAEFLNAHTEYTPKQTLEGVKGAIDGFVGEAEQFDDITMLELNYNGAGNNEEWHSITVDATGENVTVVTDYVDELLEAKECSMRSKIQIDVAIDELFSNIAKYAYPNGDGKAIIEVAFTKDNTVRIFFRDSGIPFNPLESKEPDVSLSVEERSIGGLGIFVVKKTMDKVEYAYRDGENVLMIEKKM